MQHADILSFEEIIGVVKAAIDKGVDKVRITGGEPLVRRGVVSLVKMLAEFSEIRDLAMTTNGQLLEEYAFQLKEAGLHRVNISLDTVDAEEYRRITRGGSLEKVIRGINAAREAGLQPIKINCVIKKSPEEAAARGVKEFCEQNGLMIRYIHEMDLENGEFKVVHGGSGGDCARCNRLRLTANGMIKPCLFNDKEFSVRELGVQEALRLALENKPARGTINRKGEFYNIGG